MSDAIDGAPPKGYGGILKADAAERPDWIHPQEMVARHLPMGLSERKADFVTTWDHPFRLRADHPRYSGSQGMPFPMPDITSNPCGNDDHAPADHLAGDHAMNRDHVSMAQENQEARNGRLAPLLAA